MTVRPRPRWVVPVVVAVLAAVAVVALLTRQGEYVASPDEVERPHAEPAEAATALRDLEEAVSARDIDGAAALGSDDASSELMRDIVDNAGALDVRDFTLRYVDETTGAATDGTWSAAVDMTWRFAPYDRDPVHEEVLVEFDGTGPGATVSGIGGGDRRTPLWLTEPLEVRRSADTLVAVAGTPADADRYARQAEIAVPAVRKVVPAWPGGLVVEVPVDAAALDAMLAVEPGTYADIAAVSASVDGTLTPTSPTHVFVNPDLYGGLGPVGEQVVMTHEATHIATDAPVTTGVPVWLLEGFADYVALRDTALPMSKAAGQIIAEVRSNGVPAALPGPDDFDSGATHLGASYEAAWLVCLVVADRAGENGLVGLYDDVSAGAGIAKALTSDVGVDEAELTRLWQARLERLVDQTPVGG